MGLYNHINLTSIASKAGAAKNALLSNYLIPPPTSLKEVMFLPLHVCVLVCNQLNAKSYHCE